MDGVDVFNLAPFSNGDTLAAMFRLFVFSQVNLPAFLRRAFETALESQMDESDTPYVRRFLFPCFLDVIVVPKDCSVQNQTKYSGIGASSTLVFVLHDTPLDYSEAKLLCNLVFL